MSASSSRPGYAFLLGVLFVGLIVTSTAVILLLIRFDSQQASGAAVQSSKVLARAESCVERTLWHLQEDFEYNRYAGAGIMLTEDLGDGIPCTIYPIAYTSINTLGFDRTICVEASDGTTTVNIEAVAAKLRPVIVMTQWTIVDAVEACRPPPLT
jgi:hypothetical protein